MSAWLLNRRPSFVLSNEGEYVRVSSRLGSRSADRIDPSRFHIILAGAAARARVPSWWERFSNRKHRSSENHPEICLAMQAIGTIALAMRSTIRLSDLTLTPATANDLDRLCELCWHPDVRRSLCDGVVLSRDSFESELARGAKRSDPTGMWMLETAAEGQVGYCGANYVTVPSATHPRIGSGIQIQIALHPGAWGRGFASQAVNALADLARRHCYERILAGVYESNERGHRLMSRCQFSEIVRLPGPKLVFYKRRLRDLA